MPFNWFCEDYLFSFSDEVFQCDQRTSKAGIRAVILCPTRELAAQTTRECKKLAKGKKFRIKLMKKELVRSADLSKFSCDILISTPLRLRLAIRKRKIDLSRSVVIDWLLELLLAIFLLCPLRSAIVLNHSIVTITENPLFRHWCFLVWTSSKFSRFILYWKFMLLALHTLQEGG